MTKDRKIEIQERIIHRLEEEKLSLLKQNAELIKQVNDNEQIIEEAEKCIKTYNDMIASINTLKETYLQAVEDISKYKKAYTKEINGLLKTVKKNT